MNFGWSGNSDDWYTLDTSKPPPYPLAHDMMTRIAPPYVKFVGNTVSGDGSPSSPYLDVSQAVANAPNGSTLMLKARTAYTFHGVINKPLKITGYVARVQ